MKDRVFSLKNRERLDFSKLQVGTKKADDISINIDKITKNMRSIQYAKDKIITAIKQQNETELRNISNFYYNNNGIYKRICNYLSSLYKCDWYLYPVIKKQQTIKKDKLLNDFSQMLTYFENSNIKLLFSNIALEIIKNGVFYGYLIENDNSFSLQQLNANYCRNRINSSNIPIIELNMKFFEVTFPDESYRKRVLSSLPKDFQKGYTLYKEGKLPKDCPGDQNGWYTLEIGKAFKFNLNNSDVPPFVFSIPSILDLEDAQELDRKKMMQQLLKILIQKLPLDKNGDLIFDMEEAQDIHIAAVNMLKKAVGIDILTTFADIDVVNTKDQNSTTTTDELMKVERTVYNNMGISQNLFNTSGNLALEKSIANDEAFVKNFLLQYKNFLNIVLQEKKKNSNYFFACNILETTIHNYKDLSKSYKDMVQIGYSKILPQIALGHSQLETLSELFFENEVLNFNQFLQPPAMSSTLSNGEVGRPKKETDEKNEKTILNEESKS